MINYDYITSKTMEKHNQNWPQIHDHPHSINNWGLWIWQKSPLLNLIKQQNDNDYSTNDKFMYILRIQMK